MGKKKIKEGASTCAKLNAKLPLPRSDKENKDYYNVFRFIKSPSNSEWWRHFAIDINDIKNEGDFVTSAGNKPPYFNWSPVAGWTSLHSGPKTEPNNGCCYNGNKWASSENYGQFMMTTAGTLVREKWNDAAGHVETNIVCEK